MISMQIMFVTEVSSKNIRRVTVGHGIWIFTVLWKSLESPHISLYFAGKMHLLKYANMNENIVHKIT